VSHPGFPLVHEPVSFLIHGRVDAHRLLRSSRAFTKRGLDPQAGFNVPETVRKNGSFGQIQTTLVDLPMSPWSTDPTLRKVGKLMYADSSQMPEVSLRPSSGSYRHGVNRN